MRDFYGTDGGPLPATVKALPMGYAPPVDFRLLCSMHRAALAAVLKTPAVSWLRAQGATAEQAEAMSETYLDTLTEHYRLGIGSHALMQLAAWPAEGSA